MPRLGSRVRVSFPAPYTAHRYYHRLAEWQSGHAADCKSVDAGSIPTSASIFLRSGGEIGRRKGLKIPRLVTAVPVRPRLRAPESITWATLSILALPSLGKSLALWDFPWSGTRCSTQQGQQNQFVPAGQPECAETASQDQANQNSDV